MKQTLTKNRTAFIFDLDGVFYDYGLIGPDCFKMFAETQADAATSILPHLSREEAMQIAADSYREHHDAIVGFHRFAADYGMTIDDLSFQLADGFHRITYERLNRDHPTVLTGCPDLGGLFNQLGDKVRHVLLTQSCVDSWARPVLESMKLTNHFNALIGYRECNRALKAHSTAPLELALKIAEATPAEAVFIEDTPANLARAKELDPEIMCVLVDHGNPRAVCPDFVDLQVQKPSVLFEMVAKLHADSIKPQRIAPCPPTSSSHYTM